MQVPFSIRFICTCFNSSLLIASSDQIGSCRTVSWLRRHGTDLGVKTKWRICTQLLEIFGDILDIRLPVELSWTWPVTHWRKDIRSICYPTEQKSRSFRIELFSHSINNVTIFIFVFSGWRWIVLIVIILFSNFRSNNKKVTTSTNFRRNPFL